MTPFLQEGDNKSVVSNVYKSKIGSFIYRSKVMDHLMKKVSKAAPSKASILIIGKRGVGKTYLARHIHEKSSLKKGPFQSLHCGTLSEKILETQLFGFDGDEVTPKTQGALKAADGGTLFLNEISKMSPAIQEKLLRFLEMGTASPVDSDHSYSPQVRMIYSVNDESDLVGGNVNKYLYEKMNALEMRIPSLAERKEDIPDLVRYFFSLNNSHLNNGNGCVVDDPAIDALKCYKWPGNVKELKSTCENLQALSPSGDITVRDLPPNILDMDESSVVIDYDPTLTISDINRIYILNSLKHFPSKKKAARALGITVKTLYNRLHEYGVFDRYSLNTRD